MCYWTILCKIFNLEFENPRNATSSMCDTGNSIDEHKGNFKLTFDEISKDREFAKQKNGVHYMYKENFDDPVWKEVDIRRKRGLSVTFEDLMEVVKPNVPQPIHAKKVQDIKKQTKFVPRPHCHFLKLY